MKLLLDQNLSRRLLPELASIFPGSSHVQVDGLESTSGKSVWQFARGHGFAIVTKDVDFLEMQQIFGFHPKLVWMNCGNVSNIVIQKKLVDHADAIRKMLTTTDAGVVEIE
ncbi:MAG: DUF5615 family PIN-like protein [Candidatus Accumulibacter sp.]|nr:DUF5615 family PIN-like protein [Accumulibacter sp.]